MIGRRVGGGWEVECVARAQAHEKEKVDKRKRLQRLQAIEMKRQQEQELAEEEAHQRELLLQKSFLDNGCDGGKPNNNNTSTSPDRTVKLKDLTLSSQSFAQQQQQRERQRQQQEKQHEVTSKELKEAIESMDEARHFQRKEDMKLSRDQQTQIELGHIRRNLGLPAHWSTQQSADAQRDVSHQLSTALVEAGPDRLALTPAEVAQLASAGIDVSEAYEHVSCRKDNSLERPMPAAISLREGATSTGAQATRNATMRAATTPTASDQFQQQQQNVGLGSASFSAAFGPNMVSQILPSNLHILHSDESAPSPTQQQQQQEPQEQRMYNVDEVAGMSFNISEPPDVIPLTNILKLVGCRVSIADMRVRTRLFNILLSPSSIRCFGVCFWFVFSSFFQARSERFYAEPLVLLSRTLAEVRWEGRGRRCMDVYPWCVAHAICLAIDTCFDHRLRQYSVTPQVVFAESLTEGFMNRVVSLVMLLVTGMDVSMQVVDHLRRHYFKDPDLQLSFAKPKAASSWGSVVVAGATAPGREGKNNSSGGEEEDEGEDSVDEITRMDEEFIRHMSMGNRSGSDMLSASGGGERERRGGAGGVSATKLPPEYNVLNSAVLHPEGARAAVRQRNDEQGANERAQRRSESKAEQQNRRHIYNAPSRMEMQLAATEYIRRNAPSGRIGTNDVIGEQDMANKAQAGLLVSPRCHPVAEGVARQHGSKQQQQQQQSQSQSQSQSQAPFDGSPRSSASPSPIADAAATAASRALLVSPSSSGDRHQQVTAMEDRAAIADMLATKSVYDVQALQGEDWLPSPRVRAKEKMLRLSFGSHALRRLSSSSRRLSEATPFLALPQGVGSESASQTTLPSAMKKGAHTQQKQQQHVQVHEEGRKSVAIATTANGNDFSEVSTIGRRPHEEVDLPSFEASPLVKLDEMKRTSPRLRPSFGEEKLGVAHESDGSIDAKRDPELGGSSLFPSQTEEDEVDGAGKAGAGPLFDTSSSPLGRCGLMTFVDANESVFSCQLNNEGAVENLSMQAMGDPAFNPRAFDTAEQEEHHRHHPHQRQQGRVVVSSRGGLDRQHRMIGRGRDGGALSVPLTSTTATAAVRPSSQAKRTTLASHLFSGSVRHQPGEEATAAKTTTKSLAPLTSSSAKKDGGKAKAQQQQQQKHQRPVRDAPNGIILQSINTFSPSPLTQLVVKNPVPSTAARVMSMTQSVPYAERRMRDMHSIMDHLKRSEEEAEQQRRQQLTNYNKVMHAITVSIRQTRQNMEAVVVDPLKRTKFADELIKEPVKFTPDRELHSNYLKGTFMAEATKETANEVKAQIRRLETSWALARKRKKARSTTNVRR